MTAGVAARAVARSRLRLPAVLSNPSIRRGLGILIVLIVAAVIGQVVLSDPLAQKLGEAYTAPLGRGICSAPTAWDATSWRGSPAGS